MYYSEKKIKDFDFVEICTFLLQNLSWPNITYILSYCVLESITRTPIKSEKMMHSDSVNVPYKIGGVPRP